jgi:DNA-binding MarR family transcriptional regulator
VATQLQRELKQTKPFRPQEEALVSLFRTADVLRWRISEVVGIEGVSLQQFNVLRILRGARDTGLPTLEIRSRMIEQAPGITRLVDRLEEMGLVRRERTASDRRRVLCHITPAGLDLLERLDGVMPDASEILMAPLKAAEIDSLIHSLAQLRKACAARCTSLRKQ